MLKPVSVTVNGREYVVNPFNPIQAHEFLHALIVAKGTGRGLAGLGRVVIDQCATPAPDFALLSNKSVFSKWFGEHPEDMLELESVAMDALTEPWETKQPEGAEDKTTIAVLAAR